MYTYKATLVRLIDGDTLDVSIDLGFDISISQRVKLYGIATPDSKSSNLETKERGLEAKARLMELLTKTFVIKSVLNKRGKYGRIMGIILVTDKFGDQVNLNDLMVAEGYAVEYFNGVK